MKANAIEYLEQEYEASKATPFEMDVIPNPRQAFSASNMPSASVSKAQTLADEFSVPRYMALDAIPELENESIAKRVERDKGLTEWVNQDIGNASFVRENTDAFIYAGDRITGLTMGENPNEPLSFWGNTALSYDIGNLVAESGEIGHALMSATDEAQKAELLARRKVVRENLQAAQKQRGELAFGHIGYAAEQLPLFLGSIDERLNMIADITPWLFVTGMGQGAIAGGALGGTAGSIVPGAGTAAGGASGATAGAIVGGLRGLGLGMWGGFLGGGAEHSYKLESGLFYDEFLDEKDLNEQAIPQDVLRTFATLYGIGASAIEMGGEAAFLKVLDLTGLPKALGKDAGKKALKGYIVEAMKDKSLQPILVDFAKKVTSGAAISGVEEMVQAFMSNVAEMGMKEYVANKYGTQFDDVSLTEGVVEEGIAGVSGGLWFAGGGATMRALYDGNKVRKYQKFAENSHAIFDQLEDLKGNVPAPVVESYLNTKFKDSLGQDVYLPANALLELYQSDVDLITPLNLDAVQVKQAAELGQDIPVTTSHAMANLDKAAFEQFTNIARVDAEGANVFDLQNYEIQTAEDNDRIQDLIVEWDEEQNAIDYEVDVFRQSLTANVESLPQLRLQAATYGGVEQFVNTQVELLTRMASRLAERSQGSTTVSKILQKLSFSDQPILNAMATQEQQQVDEASYAQQQEVMGYVWGKLDRDQVRSMYGDEGVDNLEMLYGRGIFAGTKRAPRLATIERKVASGEITREEAVQAMSVQGEVTKVNFDSTAQELSDLYLIDGRSDINPTDALYEYLAAGNNFYTKNNRGRKRDLDRRRNRPTVSRQGLFQGDTQRLAPNGKPSNLTPELWETVRSEPFIQWFGDWINDPENASKVVDENGEPLVVYHGTNAEFDTFDISELSSNTGNMGHYGAGFYFSYDLSESEYYGDTVIQSFLNIKNPFDLGKQENLVSLLPEFGYEQDAIRLNKEWVLSKLKEKDLLAYKFAIKLFDGMDESAAYDSTYSNVQDGIIDPNDVLDLWKWSTLDFELPYEGIIEEHFEYLGNPSFDYGYKYIPAAAYLTEAGSLSYQLTDIVKERGFDGIVYGSEIVAFEPNQIKSIENQGTFSAESDNIYYQFIGEQGLQPKGRIKAQDDGTYMISLFDGANLSTVVHEMSHFFFLEMQELDRMGLADESLQADLQTLRGWLEMEDGEDFTLEKTFGKDEESRKKRFIGRQEKLARGMELYLREGKAPVSSLRSVFSRFAIWLKHVYKQAVELGVKLNPEVKEVFDRMIATEREINMAKSKAGIVPFTGQEISSLGFTDTMKKLLEKFEMAVGNEAEQIIFSARTQARDKLRDKITKEETARINDMPIIKVRDVIRASGMNKEDVESIMGEDFARDMSNKIPTGLRRNAGKSPQELAVEHGFDDVKTMLNELMLLGAKKDMVNARVEERLAYEDSEFVAEDVLFETKAMGEYESLMAEQLLAKIQGVEVPQAAENPQAVPAAKPISNQSIKTLAWSYLREMPMKSVLRTYNFISAARKAHRLEREALSKGDYAKALEHNTQVRLNIALIQESRRINKDIEALKKRADKFILNTKANPVARYFVNDIAARMGFQTKNTRLAGGKSVADIQEWANSVEMQITPSLLGGARFYKDVTLEQFNVFADEVNAIIHLERAERKIETAQGLIDMETHAENISASIAENAGFKARKALAQESKAMHEVKRFFASLLKIDTIARMLDGDKLGIVYDSIVQPINDAYVKYNDMMAKVKKDLEGIFAVYTSKELKAFKDKKFIIQGFSSHETWTKEQVLAFALNVGNEGNMERLKNSYLEYDGLGRGEGGRLSDEQIQAVLDTLDKRDWDFIQSVWDYFEVYSKDSFDLEEKMTGVRPIKVEATQVYTPFGYYRGGYFPVVYDTAKSGKAPRDVNEDPSKKVFAVASVPHNSMKERKGVGLSGVSLKLSLDNIPQNIAKTVHNLAMREPVKNVAKVLRNDTVRSAIQGAGGVVQYKEIQDWLVDVAGGTQMPFYPLEMGARWARSSQSLMSMGIKVTTLLAQVSGMIHAMPELGVGHTLKGALHVMANLPRMGQLLDETYARSGMMRHRVRSVDREVNDFSNDVMKKGGISGWAKENAFVPMGYVQLLASDMPVWWGSYQKGLKDYAGDEQKAVKFADSMVEMTQSSGQKKDLARIQRGSEVQKMFIMYYTFFSAMYQMMYRRGVNIARNPKDIKNWFALANYVLVGMVLNNMVNEYLLGRGYDEEDDESFLEWAAKSNLMFAAQGVPVLRDVINGFFGDYGYSFTPAATGVETIIRAALKVNKSLDEDEEFDAKDVAISSAKALGYFTSNPLLGAQTTNSARELWDYLDGTDPEFEAWRIIMGAKNDN